MGSEMCIRDRFFVSAFAEGPHCWCVDFVHLSAPEWTINPRIWCSMKSTTATTTIELQITIHVFEFVRLVTCASTLHVVTTESTPMAAIEGDVLTTHNVGAMNSSHRVAGVHHQGCVLRDPSVVVIRMVCNDQHTVVSGDIVDGYAFHLQIVMAPFAD